MSDSQATVPPAAGQGRWQATRWLHLVYLVILVFQPAFDPGAAAAAWLVTVAIVAAFLPLYVVGELRPDRARWWSTVPTVLLGLVAMPFNSGASVLFVYAAASAGATEPRRYALRWFAGLTALLGVLALVSPVPMPWRLWGIGPPLVFIWVVGLLCIEDADREHAAAGLRLDNARIEHLATVSERERIARDLHDLLGHSLTSVVVRSQLAQRLAATDAGRAAAEAAQIERIARAALAEVRATVTGWRLASLDDEVESAREALTAVGVELVVRRDPDLVTVPSTESALAMALREAVTNVARHAGARTCQVTLGVRDGEVRLVVADDGVGGDAPEGNGLSGMRERIAALGGCVQRTGKPGTTVTVAVPLQVAT
ncbi:sensor histidine kinase [soil metagenome]